MECKREEGAYNRTKKSTRKEDVSRSFLNVTLRYTRDRTLKAEIFTYLKIALAHPMIKKVKCDHHRLK